MACSLWAGRVGDTAQSDHALRTSRAQRTDAHSRSATILRADFTSRLPDIREYSQSTKCLRQLLAPTALRVELDWALGSWLGRCASLAGICEARDSVGLAQPCAGRTRAPCPGCTRYDARFLLGPTRGHLSRSLVKRDTAFPQTPWLSACPYGTSRPAAHTAAWRRRL